MKLLLISHNNTTWDISELPFYQWYEVESEIKEYDKMNRIENIFFSIKTPHGQIGWIEKENFLTLQEWREKNLQQLGIE